MILAIFFLSLKRSITRTNKLSTSVGTSGLSQVITVISDAISTIKEVIEAAPYLEHEISTSNYFKKYEPRILKEFLQNLKEYGGRAYRIPITIGKRRFCPLGEYGSQFHIAVKR